MLLCALCVCFFWLASSAQTSCRTKGRDAGLVAGPFARTRFLLVGGLPSKAAGTRGYVCRLRVRLVVEHRPRSNHLTIENTVSGLGKSTIRGREGDKEPGGGILRCAYKLGQRLIFHGSCSRFLLLPFGLLRFFFFFAGAGAQLRGAELLQDFPRSGPDGGAVRSTVLRRFAAG